MLQPTLLFEHDPSELSVWISAIPRAHSTVSGPLLTVQQIYLLSFLDDCFKRSQQFPYRYIEQLTTLVPGYFSWSESGRIVACVLMAVLEQFHAKMVGQHLSTDAAVVILGYLRRVLLGLMGKMDNDKFLEAVMQLLDAAVNAAKEKGQDRPGVETMIEAMRHDIKAVFRISEGAYNEAADFPRLVDEESVPWTYVKIDALTIRTWRKSSLESLLLHGDDPDLDAETESIVSAASPAAAVRIARFLIHLLTGHPITTTIIFKRLAQVLQLTKGTELCDQVKIVVFGAAVFKEYCITEKGNEYRDCGPYEHVYRALADG